MQTEYNASAQPAVPDESQTRAYFSAVGLTLELIVDSTEDSGERWLLSTANGNIYWLQYASCAPTIRELWQRWWRQFQTSQWHRRCATLYAERRAQATLEEQQEIDYWMDRLGYLPWAKRRECWPWTAAYATYANGPIYLRGWPWVDAPKRDEAMPDPAAWMHDARLPMMINAANPVTLVFNLREAVVRIEQKGQAPDVRASG